MALIVTARLNLVLNK